MKQAGRKEGRHRQGRRLVSKCRGCLKGMRARSRVSVRDRDARKGVYKQQHEQPVAVVLERFRICQEHRRARYQTTVQDWRDVDQGAHWFLA